MAGENLTDEELREWWNSDALSWQATATTAVTTFPQGKSRVGVWDGAGNVWEWLPDNSRTAPGFKLLQGGSWYGSRRYARVSNRNNYHPVNINININIGFRVILAPAITPPSDSES